MTAKYLVHIIPASEVLPLRQIILRPYTVKLEECVYSGDDAPETAHFGAIEDGSSELAGIASIYNEAPPPEIGLETSKGRAWRLRGMGTRERHRRRGCGRELISVALNHARSLGGELVWCNARKNAIPFYINQGFEKHGELFEVEHIGPHIVMSKRIEPFEIAT